MKRFILVSLSIVSICVFGKQKSIVNAVPYIETDGVASYIDLGFVPTANTEYKLVARFAEIPSNNTCRLMASSSETKSVRFSIRQVDGTFEFNNPSWLERPPTDCTEKSVLAYLNGVLYVNEYSHAASLTVTPTATLKLGTLTGTSYFAKSIFYSAKFWESGVLIRDLIPYRGPRGVGLLDKVNDVLYTNASTSGTLTYGEEDGGSNALSPIELGGIGKIDSKRKSPYIETDGVASYIDLGFRPSSQCTYEISFRGFDYKDGTIVSAYAARNARFLVRGTAGDGFFGFSSPSISSKYKFNDKYDVSFDGTNIIVNGVSETASVIGNATSNIKLGTYVVSSGFTNVRFYSAKFWESGVLIRDLVPYSGPRGVGLLDKVNDVLYTNANTSGTLTYGEE